MFLPIRFLVSFYLLLAARCAESVAAEDAVLSEKIDFNRDVRPILSENCFKCHGFDPKTRDSGRRLDTRDGVLAEKDGVRAIVPGKLAESDVSVRIHSTDKDEQMPPPKSGKKLTPRQIAVLDRWIEEGAPYAVHWAFVKPGKVSVPKLQSSKFKVQNPIDAFVLARLEREGLGPSPEADSYTLCRRLYLDLTGLPPAPEEADAFVNDASPDAYEKLVDRLIASPRYGERWARRWLDLARYADTNGYEKDRPRSIWPYRDWVINALNAGMPFDEFTIEQIAGDLLVEERMKAEGGRMKRAADMDFRPSSYIPPSSPLIATGFHRNTMLNEEGGIDPLEFRFNAMTDRVGTTGTTWLGLTVACAQCHTHKYDPITQHDYYAMMAFLDNADEPELDLPAPDAPAQEKARQEKLAKLLAALPEKWPLEKAAEPRDGSASEAERRHTLVEEKFAAWLERERARTVRWTPLRPASARSNLPLLTVQPDASILTSGDTQKTDIFDLKYTDAPRGITAIRLEALPHDSLPAHGPGYCYYEGPKGDFFLGEFLVSSDSRPVKFVRATESYAKNNFGKNSASAAAAIDSDPQTGWSCADRPGEAHEAVFVPEQPVTATTFDLKMIFGRHYACCLGRFRISVTTDTTPAEARPFPDEIGRLLVLPDAKLTAVQREKLREQFLLTAPELASAAKEIAALRKPPVYQTTLVMQERPPENPRPTFIHNRGEFLQPTERVQPGVIAALGKIPDGAPANRLSFARWLVSPENPLTARVTMNREWAAFFGRGIVKTVNDFGLQGDAPTHPELLDWLAVEFMQRGWSTKQMHKLIVMSATYRQSSKAPPELLARDVENRLLARGPRFRLEAEMVRDAALRASGLLVEKIGGPSVRPPQPEGVTEAAYGAPKWNADTGADRYRRSLYTFSKRTAPFALYSNFDAPTGEACLALRDVSNTPLQALALLNDVTFTESAQALGRMLAAGQGSIEDSVRTGFRRCLTRPPTNDEVALLAKFFIAQKERFANGELDATAIAGDGSGDVNERAAWTALARALLNLDEMVTKS